MSKSTAPSDDVELLLAAEECERSRFEDFHRFSEHDERIIQKLMAHGPVLLQGGRGTGKSALMIETTLRSSPAKAEAPVLGLYVSLRYVPLLKASGEAYEKLFCEWVSDRISDAVREVDGAFDARDLRGLKAQLTELSARHAKRIILLFDDVAHIGRETSLEGFFDIFRTLSSDVISCKASIYPGVTEFGTRFDVYNDATTLNVTRAPYQPGFGELFSRIMSLRVPGLDSAKYVSVTREQVASFLATAVLGNVRGFIFACNHVLDALESGASSVGYNLLGDTLLKLAAGYYWPLLEEVQPKLGKYTPAVEPAKELAETFFRACAEAEEDRASVLIHRKLVAKYAKPLEILEYAGFVAKREASRAMKSSGRGTRYAVNLCNLLEARSGARLTAQLFQEWNAEAVGFVEFHEKGDRLASIAAPLPANSSGELAIFGKPIDTLRKSAAYPYGLTDLKIQRLQHAGIRTVRDLATASDEQLLNIESVGQGFLQRFRSVVAQAIWM